MEALEINFAVEQRNRVVSIGFFLNSLQRFQRVPRPFIPISYKTAVYQTYVHFSSVTEEPSFVGKTIPFNLSLNLASYPRIRITVVDVLNLLVLRLQSPLHVKVVLAFLLQPLNFHIPNHACVHRVLFPGLLNMDSHNHYSSEDRGAQKGQFRSS